MLHFRALSQSEGILDIDAEVADRALDLRMAKQPRVIMRTSLSH
jgi:hypothetical protein